ncbi:putative polyketide synthase [Lentithecium fluviatile CBS 122367]|uniref:Putative polyketide synthase n=1 Tax=Lentithecium fluviatile CBS 122367 TaxID=1168545 RepID=A0A6G1IP59_9PLEO|nr:putative polyketide synthase [Lentithecium fluviatile CBS 122367]
MASPNHVLLFPHGHADPLVAVHDLNVRSRTRAQLRTFLSTTSAVVREQTSALDGSERASIGEFEDIVELAERYATQQRPSVILDMVLSTTVQIGQLVLLAEDQPSVLLGGAGNVSIPIGFGFGTIAAAVAASASNTDAVIKLGAEALAVAFRLATYLQRMARDIEESDGTWARVISSSDLTAIEKQLDQISTPRGTLHRAYIGQVLPANTVVFGPPSTMDALAQKTDLIGTITSPSVPYRCPMYCSHLPLVDVAQLARVSPSLDAHLAQRSMYSMHSSDESPHTKTFSELLRKAVEEVVQKPVRYEQLIEAVAVPLRQTENSDVVLTTIGSTSETSEVQSLFRKHGLDVQLAEPKPLPQPYGNDISSIPSDAIAVVGMSGRFPDSDTLDEFWSLLESGTTTHQEIPSSRFSLEDFYDPSRTKHNALLARHGCFIKKPGDFDHRLFNISPREALQMDPVQRMLLMTTYESLEMAGYSPAVAADGEQVPPRIATYFGQTIDDWKSINDQQGIDTHYLPGVNRGFGPGRLCHYFQWAGGFYSIDTGCSSSATGLCLARDALAAGECDGAVVGGGTFLNAPEWFAGLSQGGFLSPTGACKTYSDQADGYCRGEGVAVVVLKRLADAVKAKDNVLAVLAGASRNCNAGSGSITYPGEQAQEALYRRVMRQAAVRPHEVDVVEMHGTGTQAGDKVETTAVQKVFASRTEAKRETPLIVGAVKAGIGHSEAAAGVVSLIKAVLILQRNTIPPQPGQPFALNPKLVPLLGDSIQLANGQPWPRRGEAPRYIFVNNFDAAGGNVSLLLHDVPSFAVPSQRVQPDERTHHVVAVSGRTETALEANKSRLRDYLIQHHETQLPHLAYTTTARRMHQVQRDAFVATSIPGLLRQLERPTSPAAKATSVVFAFTGQGAQHVGMGGKLYRTSPIFRRLLDSYQVLCDAQALDCRFLDVIRESGDATSTGPNTERDLQVATVALEIALANYWRSLGLRPRLLIGHSLGEYAALCIAGVLSVGDALALAYERATLIFKCPPSEAGMLAVGLPASTVRYRLRDSAATMGCEICCVNGPSSTVVGGPVSAIEALQEYLKQNDNVPVTRLRVSHAFHTRQMDSLLDGLEHSASRVSFHTPTIPVASTLLGRIVKPGEDGVFNANYMRRHTREPVAFLDAVRACESQGLIQDQSFVVEIGPHPICIGLMTSSLEKARPSTQASIRRGRDDWESVSQCLAAAHRAQLPISWAEFHKDHLDGLRLMSDLPTYAFELKSFWHSYKSPTVSNNSPNAVSHPSPPAGSRLSLTSLHSVEQVRKDGPRLLATFAADLSDPHLAKAIGGHVVDGVAICPASIFMDMGYTAAAYLEKESRSVATPSLATYELTSLSMTNPLVLREGEHPPHVSVEAVLDQSTNVVSVRYMSRREDNVSSPAKEHGSCLIQLNQPEGPCLKEWSRMQPLVKARLHALDTAGRREVHAMDRQLFYKIFSEIVDYSAPYHTVEEATIAADFHDASIILHQPVTSDLGTFTCNPFVVDGLVHVAGFLLNSDVRKPKNEVHIANQIGALRILGDLTSNGPYRAYATIREQDAKSGTSMCDVYLTDSREKLVALCTDICFKKLERDFFAMLTGSARAVLPKPRQKPTIPRPVQQAQAASSSSSSEADASSVFSDVSSVASEALDLAAELFEAVAGRSGISVAELKKSMGTTFQDLGVDSQMSISILADFQKATAVELPAAFFTNFPTPADAQEELGSQTMEDDDVPVKKQPNRAPSPAAAPVAAPVKRKSRRPSPTRARPSSVLFRLVSEALGLDASDLTPSTTFESVGMDSMLSIKIISTFQAETQVELPAAFFTEYPTVAAAREELDGPLDAPTQVERRKSPSPVKKAHAPVTAPVKASSESARQQRIDSAVSRAVLIQGKSRSRAAPLFMTTDGSGTVESYIHLSALPEGRRIYALESPFLETPDVFDLSIEEMASIFIRSIRRIQPQGPYLIGGWSAGSIYAYEVAHRLMREGEDILALIILDMRAPSLIPTAIVTTDFVDKLGTFEGINRARDLPEDLSVKEKAHLMATCRALSRYDAPAFPAGRQPRQASVVWARLGLDNRPDAPKANMLRPGLELGKPLAEMNLEEFQHYFNSWFYGRRDQFGTNGWEEFVGEHVEVYDVDGDHFSMMCPPFASAVGQIVADTVTRAVEEEAN